MPIRTQNKFLLFSYPLNLIRAYFISQTYIKEKKSRQDLQRLTVLWKAPDTSKYVPYARHYKPRLVYFFTPFPKTIYVLWPLALCMACIQEWLLIKSGLWWRAYSRLFQFSTKHIFMIPKHYIHLNFHGIHAVRY